MYDFDITVSYQTINIYFTLNNVNIWLPQEAVVKHTFDSTEILGSIDCASHRPTLQVRDMTS